MKTLAFVLWMIFWPLSNTITRYICFKMEITFSEGIKNAAVIFDFIIWVGIGHLLYQNIVKIGGQE